RTFWMVPVARVRVRRVALGPRSARDPAAGTHTPGIPSRTRHEACGVPVRSHHAAEWHRSSCRIHLLRPMDARCDDGASAACRIDLAVSSGRLIAPADTQNTT